MILESLQSHGGDPHELCSERVYSLMVAIPTNCLLNISRAMAITMRTFSLL